MILIIILKPIYPNMISLDSWQQ